MACVIWGSAVFLVLHPSLGCERVLRVLTSLGGLVSKRKRKSFLTLLLFLFTVEVCTSNLAEGLTGSASACAEGTRFNLNKVSGDMREGTLILNIWCLWLCGRVWEMRLTSCVWKYFFVVSLFLPQRRRDIYILQRKCIPTYLSLIRLWFPADGQSMVPVWPGLLCAWSDR